MSSSFTEAEGSFGNVEVAEELDSADFLELRNAPLLNNRRVTEGRFEAIDARFAKIEELLSLQQGRMSKLKQSVRRALVDILPKVEELLARHLSPQPSCEAAPAGASVAPSDDCTSTAPTNIDSSTGYSPRNPQLSLVVAGSGKLVSSCPSPSGKAADAPVTDGECLGKAPPALSATGSWASFFRPSAPPPSAASCATNHPASSLHEAAERGDAAAVQRFLAVGAQVDARDKDGNTALHIAASSGRTEVVDILIAKGAAVNRRGLRSRTPLHCAAAKGHETIVARLVTVGATLYSRDADGATVASLAAQGGHAEVVLWLLDNGTPVEARDNENRTLLMYAVEGGNLQLVKYLLGKGANLNAVTKKGETPIFTAVNMQRIVIVKYLLQNGVLPFKALMNNESPLMLCSKKGYGDTVGEMLKVATSDDIEHLKCCLIVAGSADVVWSFVDEARDLVLGPAGGQALVEAARDGRLEVMEALLRVGVNGKASLEMALRAAAEKGRRGCIVALLDAGVDVNARHIWTALHWAAWCGHAECVEVLLQRGDKNDQSTEEVLVNAAYWGRLDVLKILLRVGAGAKESREEALGWAAHGGHRGCIVALLDAGVDVNAGDNYNGTALHWAAVNGHAECVKELLRRGAKEESLTEVVLVNAAGKGHLAVLKVLLALRVNTNVSFEEALRVAAKKGHRSCVAALLDAGVDVNARHSNLKYTALHLAAKNGHVDCVKELLQRGAKKDLKDFNGYTAFKLARKNKMQACTDILES
ncbi:hypothetical protein R5R35_013265 [Gryllus longicercus]|uniref:Uncharacterized protein n=1 Tax=Gryllus longicercus TaxID=2509291 RepID=A0AAN9Z9T2_9ORTH